MKKIVVVIALFALTSELHAASFQEWVVNRINKQVAKRDPATQQIDPPAALLPEANVADLAAGADVVSLALNFAGVGEEPKDAQSLTASVYALIVGATGGDPDDVQTMRDHAKARQWFVTVGTKEETDDEPPARLFQAKWLVYDGRALTSDQVKQIQESIERQSNSTLETRIQQFVLTRPRVLSKLILPHYREALTQQMATLGLDSLAVARRVERLPSRIATAQAMLPHEPNDTNAMKTFDLKFWAGQGGIIETLVSASFDDVSKLLSESDGKAVDELIVAELDPFSETVTTARDVVSKARRRPQFALAANLLDPQSDDARKTFGLEAIYTQGIATFWNFTANATYKRPEAVNNDDELTLAALFRRQLRAKAKGRTAMYLDLGGDASLLNDKRTYRAQAKATITLLQGLQVPISVTWANRDDLVDESNVVGHIGISFDFSKAGEFFKRSTPEDDEE